MLTSYFQVDAVQNKSCDFGDQCILIGNNSDCDIKHWIGRVGTRWHRPTQVYKQRLKNHAHFSNSASCCRPLKKCSTQPVRGKWFTETVCEISASRWIAGMSKKSLRARSREEKVWRKEGDWCYLIVKGLKAHTWIVRTSVIAVADAWLLFHLTHCPMHRSMFA